MKLIKRTSAGLLSLRLNGLSAQMLYRPNRLVFLGVSLKGHTVKSLEISNSNIRKFSNDLR